MQNSNLLCAVLAHFISFGVLGCSANPNTSTEATYGGNRLAIAVPTTGGIQSVSVSPLPLIPDFSSSIYDFSRAQ